VQGVEIAVEVDGHELSDPQSDRETGVPDAPEP